MTIDDFIERLELFDPAERGFKDTVFNMYHGNSKSAVRCRENLKKYLESHKDANILFVGEAPGYNGCAKTGVPFTSDTGEPSSKIIQEIIQEYHNKDDILFWNAFPFHPHQKGDKNSNRKPNPIEIDIGQTFLEMLFEMIPTLVCVGAVGKTAERSLKSLDLYYEPVPIRHPSFGGKKQCKEDMECAFICFSGILRDEKIIRSVASAQGNKAKAAYHYLQEHRDEFLSWYVTSDHLEYDYAYFLVENINLDEYEDWPKYLWIDESLPYLDKIKLDYIISAECERDDPTYEKVASDWTMKLRLNVHGWKSTVFISSEGVGEEYYKKFDKLLSKSDDFVCKSEVPNQYGYYVYERKDR